MVKTNRDHLVIQSVMDEIAHPRMQNPFLVGQDGIPQVVETGGTV